MFSQAATQRMNFVAGRAPNEIRQLDDRSRQIIAELPEGFMSFDEGWRFVECNPAAERLLKRDRRELLGRQFCDFAGLGWDTPFAKLIRGVAANRKAENAEVTLKNNQRSRVLSIHAYPLGEGVAAICHDITAARAAERRLARSEARYREIADGLPAAAWLSRANGELEFINQAMVDSLGKARSLLLGDGWLDSIDPEDRRKFMSRRAQAWEHHSSFHYEGRFRRPGGDLRIIELDGRPRFDGVGRFRGYLGIATDVTDAREAQLRHRLLVNELNHRVKNTLATVQALVRLTLQEHEAPTAVEHDFVERLAALSSVHDTLNRTHWKSADLRELLGEVTLPYDGRISIAGPKAKVAPNVAIALAMGFHELATNAAKYGALSIAGGRIELSWSKSEAAVALQWKELGGPSVAPPEKSGFGSRLLGKLLSGQLGRPAEMVYTPEGLVCRLQAPLAE